LVIPPDRLRALLIAEAELGQRIMHALILRRVALIEKGTGGPIIVGHAEHGDVLRLRGFLSRNGHPCQCLDPATDPEAVALLERFQIDPNQLPAVLCPDGTLLFNPTETNLAAAQAMGVATNRQAADAFAANVLPIVRQIQAAGATTFRAIATALNDRGVRTARGGAWHDSTVRNLLARAG
jgi:hypothetical protein